MKLRLSKLYKNMEFQRKWTLLFRSFVASPVHRKDFRINFLALSEGKCAEKDVNVES